MQLSEQEIRRREEKTELENLGINPYPPELFEVNVTSKDILTNYEKQKTDYKNISIAGRLMSRRIMGSASFAVLQDEYGKIQIYLRRDDICPGEDKSLYNTVFKKLLDIGDIIGVNGYVFTTQTGEISIYVKKLKVLSKSLRPLPIVKETTDKEGNIKLHDAFSDAEQRYRQRYVDLIVNSEVKETFKKRTRLVNSIRDYLNNRGYLEVETPIPPAIIRWCSG
jgi:lysyl-tRNA synthetase class 2